MRIKFPQLARHLLAVAAITCLTACSPKLDGASLEAFAASAKEITAKMSRDEVRQFDADLMTIMRTKGLNLGQLAEHVNGMTVSDVRRSAATLDAAFKRSQLEQVDTEIAKLEREDALADAQRAEVAKFVIAVNSIKGQWKFDPQGYDRPENQAADLSLTLTNNTPHTIAKFHYYLNLSIDGAERGPDPWSFELEKPLVPGETRELVITDKAKSEGHMGSSISSRVTNPMIEALKTNPDAQFSASIRLSSIVLADGTHMDAEPGKSETRLRELREQKASLMAATLPD